MSDEVWQRVRQNIRRDLIVGAEELFIGAESPQHHVANNQQRPAIAQDLHGSIQWTPRPPLGIGLLLRHFSTLTFFTCILQVTCCRLAFPSPRFSVAS